MIRNINALFRAIRRLIAILPKDRRRGAVLVFGVALLSGFFELLGVFSVLPFMTIVMNPDAINKMGPLADIFAFFGFSGPRRTVLAMSMITVTSLLLTNIIGALSLWTQSNYVAQVRAQISAELFRGFLRQPYLFHVERDMPSLMRAFYQDVDQAIGGFMNGLFSFIAKSIIALSIFSLLFYYEPWVAVGTGLVLGGGYVFIFRLLKGQQRKLGQLNRAAYETHHRRASEGLGGIKELKILQREEWIAQSFERAIKQNANVGAWNGLLSSLPRYAIEFLAFGGLVAITLFLLVLGDWSRIIPTLSLYALAGYRLMPAFQQIYAAAGTLEYTSSSVRQLEEDLTLVRGETGAPSKLGSETGSPDISFQKQIRFSDVTFQYPKSKYPVLNGLNLDILKNESLGIVGKTGSGKTTLVDLIIGLYEPKSGLIKIDDVILDRENCGLWQSRIGYVPQFIYLTNGTVSSNIALGLNPAEIDMEAVRRAAHMAQIDEFIKTLPDGYDTIVGERGVKLSGGQRQRIGIARALYHSPDVLIFDEATSALDMQTESAVIDAIKGLKSKMTIILIAHRLDTVKFCDRLIMLEKGTIVAEGSYDHLLSRSRDFQSLVLTSSA